MQFDSARWLRFGKTMHGSIPAGLEELNSNNLTQGWETIYFGEMAEWLMAVVLKTTEA